jgi:hypothetical protein
MRAFPKIRKASVAQTQNVMYKRDEDNHILRGTTLFDDTSHPLAEVQKYTLSL